MQVEENFRLISQRITKMRVQSLQLLPLDAHAGACWVLRHLDQRALICFGNGHLGVSGSVSSNSYHPVLVQNTPLLKLQSCSRLVSSTDIQRARYWHFSDIGPGRPAGRVNDILFYFIFLNFLELDYTQTNKQVQVMALRLERGGELGGDVAINRCCHATGRWLVDQRGAWKSWRNL